jgi:hypothetical protein
LALTVVNPSESSPSRFGHIKFRNNKIRIRSLMTFDQIMQSDELMNPELFDSLDKQLRSSDSDVEKSELFKQLHKASKEMKYFVKSMLSAHLEYPKDMSVTINFMEGMLLYKLLYERSTRIEQNLGQPSELASLSD